MGTPMADRRRGRRPAQARGLGVADPDADAGSGTGRGPGCDLRRVVLGVQPARGPAPAHDADQSLAGPATRRIRHQKKRPRPSEIDRPDVQRKRAAFVRWRRRIDPERLVFLDEAGANLSMGRSHAWVKKGRVHVEPRPMNWGKNLTLIGAIRRDGWVTLATQWTAATAGSFVTWVRRRLVRPAPRRHRRARQPARAHGPPRPSAPSPVRGPPALPAAVLVRLQSHRSRVGAREEATPRVRPTHGARIATDGTRCATCRHATSLSSMVRPCRIRQLKYYPGLIVDVSPVRAFTLRMA